MKTPVERRIEQLRDLWMQATQPPETRLLIWRIPANASRMMAAFFEVQKHPGDWNTPDFFLHFDTAFETSFDYSRSLKAALLGSYHESQSSLQDQGIAQDWQGENEFHPDSAIGVVSLLASFAQHHQQHLRYLAAVFEPRRCSSDKTFQQWLELALRAPVPANLRIVLIDTQETRHWQALAKRHAHSTRIIEAPIDMFDIARETAAQTGKGGPAVAYRQLLTDVMTLLERGSAEQVAQRARHALRMTERLGWADQKVVLHMAIAGAWMKENQYQKALTSYKQARDCAATAESEGHPAGISLRMQSWFGEAGVWLKSGKPIQAAESYLQGALAAVQIPDPIFTIEGYRMAGFCYQQGRCREEALDNYLLAIRASLPLPREQRVTTTLPLVLQDLLQMQNKRRAWALGRYAEIYQARIAKAHARAEHQSMRFGAYADKEALDRIEAEMHLRFEKAFQRTCKNRERIIAHGDEFFRKIVAAGRMLLHPTWSGLPDIKHPLDKDITEWSDQPALATLPDPGELVADTETVSVEPAPARTTNLTQMEEFTG